MEYLATIGAELSFFGTLIFFLVVMNIFLKVKKEFNLDLIDFFGDRYKIYYKKK